MTVSHGHRSGGAEGLAAASRWSPPMSRCAGTSKGHDPCVCRGGEGGVESRYQRIGPFTVSTRRLSRAALKGKRAAAPHSN